MCSLKHRLFIWLLGAALLLASCSPQVKLEITSPAAPASTATPDPGAVATTAPPPTPFQTGAPERTSSLPAPIRSLAADPHDLRAVYALLASGDLYRSLDRAGNWERLALPAQDPAEAPWDDLAPPDILFFEYHPGLALVRSGESLYRSRDGGETWQPLIDGVTLWTAAGTGEGVVLYAWRPDPPDGEPGLYRGREDGDRWARVAPAGFPPGSQSATDAGGILSLALDSAGETIYAGTPNGIYRATAHNHVWERFDTGLPPTGSSGPRAPLLQVAGNMVYALVDLASDGEQPRLSLARLEHGQIIPDQDHWLPVWEADFEVHELIADPVLPDHLYLAADQEVLASLDRGQTWETLPLPGSGPFYRLAASSGPDAALFAWGPSGLVRAPLKALVSQEPGPSGAAALEIVDQAGGAMLPPLFAGDLAYVARGPRLYTLDVRDPAAPQLLGESGLLPGAPTHAFLLENSVFLAAGEAGLLGVDVSDPAAPRWVSTLPARYPVREAYLQGKLAYLVENACLEDACQGLVRVADLSDPSGPRETALLEMPTAVRGLAFSGGLAYALLENGLLVLDLEDPASPVELGKAALEYPWTPIVVREPYVFLGGNGLHVVDVSDPHNPHQAAFVSGYAHYDQIVLSGQHAYLYGQYCDVGVCFGQSMAVDVSDPAEPVLMDPEAVPPLPTPGPQEANYLIDPFGPLETVSELVAQDGRVFAPGMGYSLLDVSDPANPQAVAPPPALVWPSGRALLEGYAYVPGWWQGLEVYDLLDPLTASLVISETVLGGAADSLVAAGNERAYLLVYGGLAELDVTDPARPQVVRRWPVLEDGSPASTGGAAIGGSHAFVLTHSYQGDRLVTGLAAFDLLDPEANSALGVVRLEIESSDGRVLLAGDTAFLALKSCGYFTCTGGLWLVDVSDPRNPRPLGGLALPGGAYDAAVLGQYAVVAGGERGLWLVDVSDPLNPSLTAILDTPGEAQSMALLGDLIYVADGARGVLVVRIVTPG